MRKRVFLGLLVVLCVGVAAASARAGVVIEQQTKSGDTGEVMKTITYVEPGLLRSEMQMGDQLTIMIFRADRQVVWMIQPREKTYREMTQADVERLAGQMDAARQRMEAMLKSMPPEQRAMAEQMMKQQMGAEAQPVKMEVKKLGRESVGKFSATKYELLADGERAAQIWAASVEQLNIQKPEMDTFLQFAKFFEKLSRTAGEMTAANVLARHWESIEGFPVKTVSYEGGEVANEQQVVRAERQSLGDDKFQLPPGLKKIEMAAPQPER